MKYLVYHARNMMDMIEHPPKVNLENYDLVAMVKSETLDMEEKFVQLPLVMSW
jgi:hypothetical protein